MSELEESKSDLGPSTWSMDVPMYLKTSLWVLLGIHVIFYVVIFSGLNLEGWKAVVRSPLWLGILLLPVAMGLICWMMTRSLSLMIREDKLEYSTRLGRTHSMKLDEIVKAEEKIHSAFKIPSKLVIQDKNGRRFVVDAGLMGVPDYEEFHEALKYRLEPGTTWDSGKGDGK